MCYTRGHGSGMRHGGKGNERTPPPPRRVALVRRVVTDGVTPEQAVDEATARIKQILNK